MYVHENTQGLTQTHFSYFYQIIGNSWQCENYTCLSPFLQAKKKNVCTGMCMCVMTNSKEERKEGKNENNEGR